jgi:hypothetical protein
MLSIIEVRILPFGDAGSYWSCNPQHGRADTNEVSRMQLTAAPELRLAVDRHLPAGDQCLGVPAGGRTGKLEELAKADHVARDLNRLLHAGSVSPADGRLRHPRFPGLCDDKAAAEVVREA